MWAVRLVAIGAASWTGSFGSVMFMHYYVPLSWRGWISTFFLTIFVDLVAAIEIGVVLAALLFMRRMILVTEIGFTDLKDEIAEEDGAGERVRRDPRALLEALLSALR